MIDKWLGTLSPRNRRIAVVIMLILMILAAVTGMNALMLVGYQGAFLPELISKDLSMLGIMVVMFCIFIASKRISNTIAQNKGTNGTQA